MSEINKTSAQIILGGETITIQKLKAGKFYDAQKVIAEMFRQAAKLTSSKEVVGGKTPDIDVKNQDLAGLVGMFEDLPQQVSKFVAICVGMDEKELLEKAFPEEITEAFSVCLELNNVMENLKNSVAPIGKLGATGNK